VFSGILELLPFFGEVSTIARIIHLNVKGGSVLRILQLLCKGDAFFKDGFGEMKHSAVNSVDLATLLVSIETIGFWKRCISSITLTVFL